VLATTPATLLFVPISKKWTGGDWATDPLELGESWEILTLRRSMGGPEVTLEGGYCRRARAGLEQSTIRSRLHRQARPRTALGCFLAPDPWHGRRDGNIGENVGQRAVASTPSNPLSDRGTGGQPPVPALRADSVADSSGGLTPLRAGTPRTESGGDRDLAARVLAGDRDAFEGLYRQHSHRLYNLVYRMAGSAEADDLLQDVFLQAYRKLGTYKGDSSLGTWLYRLAANLCLDHLRSRQGKMGQLTDSIDEEDAAPLASPGRPAEANNARLDLEQAIAALPPSYRATFVLHDVEGYQHDEISRMLGIAEGSSKSLLHKARLRLRTILA
jgi:RNA polymerase sigma-70 factor, ECF subfamily